MASAFVMSVPPCMSTAGLSSICHLSVPFSYSICIGDLRRGLVVVSDSELSSFRSARASAVSACVVSVSGSVASVRFSVLALLLPHPQNLFPLSSHP